MGDRGDKSPPLLKVGGGGHHIICPPPPPLFWIKPITENMKNTSILLFCLISATQCIKMSIFDGKYSKSPYRGRGASPPPTPPPGPARSLRALAQCPPHFSEAADALADRLCWPWRFFGIRIRILHSTHRFASIVCIEY